MLVPVVCRTPMFVPLWEVLAVEALFSGPPLQRLAQTIGELLGLFFLTDGKELTTPLTSIGHEGGSLTCGPPKSERLD